MGSAGVTESDEVAQVVGVCENAPFYGGWASDSTCAHWHRVLVRRTGTERAPRRHSTQRL